jgi:hypothetical protein
MSVDRFTPLRGAAELRGRGSELVAALFLRVKFYRILGHARMPARSILLRARRPA